MMEVMDTAATPDPLTLARQAGDATPPRAADDRPWDKAQSEKERAGTSSGVNIEPGSNDDGWKIPPRVSLSDGTQLQLYKDGEALHAGYDAIQAAKRRICLEVYIFHSDSTGRAFAELLAQRAREGIAVYVIYDSLASWDTDRQMFKMMRDAGVRLAAFHPIRPWECVYSWRPANRDHRKILIIDDEMAGLGGLNIGAEYAGSWVVSSHDERAPWRDTAIGIRGPSARQLLIPFARTWRYVQHGGKLRNTEYISNLDSGEFGVVASVPGLRRPWVALRSMFAGAKKSISLTMSYFAPPDAFIADLCRAARRKVRVRLMIPEVNDIPLLTIAARSFYERLLTAGVEIYERQAAVLHAKTLCIDGCTSIIGSTNLDYRSIEYNTESSVIIRNPQFGAQMDCLFDNDVKYSKRITLREWRKRPTWDRFVQWSVNRARYLL